jgi:hypothetical protein
MLDLAPAFEYLNKPCLNSKIFITSDKHLSDRVILSSIRLCAFEYSFPIFAFKAVPLSKLESK